MKTQKAKAPSSIRFRRWSRAGYAIFCSLACAVTIGCVAVSISDKSLQKAAGVSNSSVCSLVADSDSKDKPDGLPELEVTLQQLQESILLNSTSDSAAACHQVSNIYFINQNG